MNQISSNYERELEIIQKDICWSQKKNAKELLKVTVNILNQIDIDSEEILNSSIKIPLWSITNIDEVTKMSSANLLIKYIESKLVAECFVSLNKLLSEEIQEV